MSATKVAIVTGGASGIGLAAAQHLAGAGYRVAILDADAARGPAAAAALAPDAMFVRCDVASWADQRDAFARVHAALGAVDLVVANAGVVEPGFPSLMAAAADADAEPEEPSLRVLDINLAGVVYSIKLAIHYMQKPATAAPSAGQPADKRHGGAIVCTASNAALYPFPAAPLYAASKAGIVALVRALARPLGERFGITINALAPSVVSTGLPADDTMILTPMATVVRGLAGFIAEPDTTGAVAEIHGDSVTVRPPLPYVDADTEENYRVFYRMFYG